MKNYKIIFFQFVVLLGCQPGASKKMLIDFSTLNKTSELKIVLSEFRFNVSTTLWEWIKIDSMCVKKDELNDAVEWKKKYDHTFIAAFKVFNRTNLIVAESEEFIFSPSCLLGEPDPAIKPITMKNRYYNAVTYAISGGENALYANRDFLAPPHISGAGELLSKIGDKENLPPSTAPAYTAWRKYEQDVVENTGKCRDCYYTLFRLISICDQISSETLKRCLSELDNRLKKTNEGVFLVHYYANATRLFVGSRLPVFQIQTTKQQSSKSLLAKHRYYFIDFWASWCGPCRQQMGEIKVIYPSVDTNKIQFVSLSIDKSPQAWLIASAAERLKWPSFLGVNIADDDLMHLFALRYIPQNLVINPDGFIMAKNIDLNGLKSILGNYHLQKSMINN